MLSANSRRAWAWPDAERVPCGKFAGPGAKFQPSADGRQKTGSITGPNPGPQLSLHPDQRIAYSLSVGTSSVMGY